ncbi:hypothetical protein ABD91_00835 [Lysinibacillus sphaericus]|uniref:hypothetical protein n=1 Tax=Lysinibacillus sphaericus TaxID=1421 RepID=UPI0018CE80CE|nr:hypothetical protein [Lysinibacillus sphaericus]MBG9689472.1 hypothetical protein [Lysinibacillus sphaericus]
MIVWKNFSFEKPDRPNNYLVSDGKNVDIALYEQYDIEEGYMFYLPERTNIDGEGSITHFAEINLPSSK